MADPSTPPAKQTAADIAAIYAARDAAVLTNYFAILDDLSVAYDPETITLDEAVNEIVGELQGVLTAAGAPYNAYDLEVDYDPLANGNRSYLNYLHNIYLTIP